MYINQYKNINENEGINFNIAVCKYWIDTQNRKIEYNAVNKCIQLAKLHKFKSHDYCTTLLNVCWQLLWINQYNPNSKILHLLFYPYYYKYKSTTIDVLS